MSTPKPFVFEYLGASSTGHEDFVYQDFWPYKKEQAIKSDLDCLVRTYSSGENRLFTRVTRYKSDAAISDKVYCPPYVLRQSTMLSKRVAFGSHEHPLILTAMAGLGLISLDLLKRNLDELERQQRDDVASERARELNHILTIIGLELNKTQRKKLTSFWEGAGLGTLNHMNLG